MTLAFPPRGDDRPYDADAVKRFPWPAVAGYNDVHHWMDQGQAVHAAWQLRDVWESLIRFLGCVALSDRLVSLGADDPVRHALLARLLTTRGLSIGYWPELMIRALQETPADQLHLPALKEILFAGRRRLMPLLVGGDERQSFVCWRKTRFAHGTFGRTSSVYRDEALHWLEHLHLAYDRLRDLLGALTLETDDPAGGPLTWDRDGPAFTACHTHQPAVTGPAVRAVRLRIPGQEALDLTPLLSVQRCAVCDQWSAFTLDKTRPARRSAQFLELLAGHVLADRGHARLSEWLGCVTLEEIAAAEEHREPEPTEPDPMRFRDFKGHFEPPDYLVRELAALLGGRDRGVVWLNGAGGLGKSWLCAGLEELLRDALGRALPTLVLSVQSPRPPRAGDVVVALRLLVQRDKPWQVPAEVDAPYPWQRIAGWLAALMHANHLGELLVCLDGLDELPADSDVGELLPPAQDLPPGCLLLLSSRPELKAPLAQGLERCRSAGPFAELPMRADRPEHREVLRRYAHKQLAQKRADGTGLPPEWVEPVIDKAAGSFLYVFHYCQALHHGVYASLGELPSPEHYYPAYFAHLRGWVGEQLFADCYVRTLALLAVAQQPVGLSHLEAWGLERGRLVMVLNDLADFLRVHRGQRWHDSLNDDGDNRYELAHEAFVRWLHSDPVLRKQQRQAHVDIAEVALKSHRGRWEELDPYDDPSLYHLRFLGTHLREVGRAEEAAGLVEDAEYRACCWRVGYEAGEKQRLQVVVDMFGSLAEALRILVEAGRSELSNNLASALTNLGIALCDLGQLALAEAACQEAIAIRRVLVGAGRTELSNELAGALNTLGNALCVQGQLPPAVAAYQEAIAIRRALVGAGCTELSNDLAMVLNNLGNSLRDQGQLAPAVAAYQEAIGLVRAQVGAGRSELNIDLARALNNLGNALRNRGQLAPAVAAYQEAIGLYRALVGAGRTKLSNDLAMVLNNLGNALSDQGQFPLAVAAYHESIAIRRVLAGAGRTELSNNLASALNNIGTALLEQGQLPPAVVALQESIAIRRALVKAGRSELNNDLAMALNNLRTALRDQGQFPPAVTAYQESIAIRRALVGAGRTELSNDLATVLNNLGNALSDQGRLAQAVPAYQEAISLVRAQVGAGRSELNNDLARALICLGNTLSEQGQLSSAVSPHEEGVALYTKLVEHEGRRELLGDLAWAQSGLALTLLQLGQRQRAYVLATEAVRVLTAEVERTGRSDLAGVLRWAQNFLHTTFPE